MRDRYPFYLWLVPLIWAVGTTAQHRFPGDENALYILSAIPGLWIAPIFMLAHVSKEAIPFCVALAGLPVMVLVGWMLERLGVSKLLWAFLLVSLSVAICRLTIASYPSIERAIGANGSLWAYRLLGVNLGLYLSVPLSIIATAVIRLVKGCRAIRKTCGQP